jgi:hypothetical protein
MYLNHFPARLLCYCFILFLATTSSNALAKPPARNYYQLKIYHYKNQAQENKIGQYLQDAYIPALHRAGIEQVGVFTPVTQLDTDRRIYVFIPFPSLKKLVGIDRQLQADADYATAARDYTDAGYQDPPYSRIEIILLEAFRGMPSPAAPHLTAAKSDRVYELRSYESPTEKYNLNKVDMFHAGEIGLFSRLGFNAVFYSEVIAGTHMPNLMYMTTFNSMEDRDEHWKAFFSAPEWKALIAKAEYKNNVSNRDIVFLHPAAYSDF